MRRFDNLPEEIVLDIFTRVPTEAALNCKLVCKPWRDVVHHPSFSQLHLNHLNSVDDTSGKLSYLFFCRRPEEFSYVEYDENYHGTPFFRKTRMNLNLPFRNHYIVGSYNGLICFGSWSKSCTCVCNPITREYITLPTSEGNYWWFGFGYIPSTNEYKVVRIYESGGISNVGIVQVYTLGSGTGWRNSGKIETNMKYVKEISGVFANGALHWENHHERAILAFDLTVEMCSKLPMPPCITYAGVIKLGVLGNCVCLQFNKGNCCEIWLLKKYKDNHNDLSWNEEFRFGNNHLNPFGYTKSGRLLYHENSKLYSYPPEASSAETDVSFGKDISQAIPHKNTLVSLKVLGEQRVETMG